MEASAVGHFNADVIAQVASLQQRLTMSEQTCAELVRKLALQEQNNLYYKERYELLRKEFFGRKSERRELSSTIQMPLLPGFDDANRPTAAVEPQTETISYTRTKAVPQGTPKERGSRFPESLRRVHKDVVPEETNCSCCGEAKTHCIRTEVTEKLSCSRDPFYVTEYSRPVMGCRACDTVFPMTPIPEVFERTMVDHTVVAYFLTNKFRYSLPLYRQGQQCRDIGLIFSNDAIIDWVLRGLDLLMPVYQMLVSVVLKCHYLIADDTRFKAAVGPVKKSLPQYKQGALWGLYGQDIDAVVYVFTNSRTHKACDGVLEGFQGKLIVDGYDGFETVGATDGVELVHCNNHARRGFVRAEGSDKKRAHEGLGYYQLLYQIEEEGKGLSVEERTTLRQAKAVPVFEQFKLWVTQVNQAAPPKSPLGKACAYVLKRWKSLTAYTQDGNIPIDTMAVERAFRVVAIGRKNFLHAASETGAHGAAAGYSLINTCIIQGVDPFIYLCDVLERVGSCSQHEIEKLLPQNWKVHYLDEATKRYATPFAPTATDDPLEPAAVLSDSS